MSKVLEVNDDLPIKTDEPVHSGKVRAVYWLTKEDSARLIKEKGYDVAPDSPLAVMVISDRISAFDCIWKGQGGMNGVPLKGAALNAISNHWFKLFKEKGLAESHILDIPHPLVWIVRKARPVMIEAISRQYITGSMWRDYSKGNREFCGLKIPDGLKNNQKLDKLLITPSTKGILEGIPGVPAVDDVNISRSDIEKNYKAFNFSSKAHINDYEKLLVEGFNVISDALKELDQIFVDTKFEFGYVTDRAGKEKLIYMDEVGTPDSSRIWDGPAYRNSGKVIENSKEGFRQLLLKHFPDPDIFTNKDRMAERKKLATDNLLPQSVLMEVSKTYSDIAEKITGSKLRISEDPRGEIMTILDVQYGLIKKGQGGSSSGKPLVVIAAGSDSDMPHLETLKREVGKFKIDAEIRICSAHKQPAKLELAIQEYNNSKRPIMMVGCAGGTDALSGTASYLAKFPVVSCPPDGMNHTCLTNPPGSSNAFIVKPANIGKFAAQAFAKHSPEIDAALQAAIAEKIVRLEKADEQLAKRQCTGTQKGIVKLEKADEQLAKRQRTGSQPFTSQGPIAVQTLGAVGQKQIDEIKVKTALISLFDKTGIEELGKFLKERGVHILSTGGTAKKLRELGCTVQDVADYTGSREILDGRVKSLHPKVHGGLLAARGSDDHMKQCQELGIRPIDLVVVNLYPFKQAVKEGGDFATCVENIDIGGPAMVRASAKNHAGVCIVTNPSQYPRLMQEVNSNNGSTCIALRKSFAAAAFATTAAYDAAISTYMASQVDSHSDTISLEFTVERPLKYGCNPHQNPAGLCLVNGTSLPFKVVSGTPGYINLLDAINAWQLVHELGQATGLPAAASFKHVSPAGAAIGVPLSEVEKEVYEVAGKELTPVANAYVRARNADPMCSFGDFVAISHEVDLATANILKIEVSDGIVAPSFTPEALAILKAKKGGKFIVLEADKDYVPPETEYRTIYGMGFTQKRNDAIFDKSRLQKVVTALKELPQDAINDLVLCSIAVKFTQSNSVGYSKSGMMIGVGAGQQSRVDCVKLAGRKVTTWQLRFHPKVRSLPFKQGTKRQERVNARVRYIEGDFTETERKEWEKLFDKVPEALTEDEKADFMKTLDNVAISSDAFFPFRDSIDFASKLGVKYVAQPGGSVADAEVIGACDIYKMVMAFTELRLFHH